MTNSDQADFARAGSDASAAATAIAEILRTSAVTSPIARLVMREAERALVEASNAIGDMLTPDAVEATADDAPSLAPARAKPRGEHRHKFGPDNICAVPGCGKAKSANGRKPAASSGAVTGEAFVDTRTLPLPAARLVGDAAADGFADGGQGSSGVRR